MDGWLNVYKPKGVSSAYFGRKIGRVLGSKIGHAGTLDPLAEGVLPLALGAATRLIDYVMLDNKIYEFVMQFGQQTTTADAEGEVLNRSSCMPTEEDLLLTLKKFLGSIEQIPPAYSAIKINGQRAYDMARSNKEVIIPSRKITIYSIDLIDYDYKNKRARIVCKCSKGTYIRTLCEDIAFSLQNFAFVLELRRLESGIFKSDDALHIKLDEDPNILLSVASHIMPISTVLDDIPVLDVDDHTAWMIRCGQRIPLTIEHAKKSSDLWIRYNGKLLSIGNVIEGEFIVKRVFNLT